MNYDEDDADMTSGTVGFGSTGSDTQYVEAADALPTSNTQIDHVTANNTFSTTNARIIHIEAADAIPSLNTQTSYANAMDYLNDQPNYVTATDSLPTFNTETDIAAADNSSASVYATAADSSSTFHNTGDNAINGYSVRVNAYDTGPDENPDLDDEVDVYDFYDDAPMLSLSAFHEILGSFDSWFSSSFIY
jgi:hypothetical protein